MEARSISYRLVAFIVWSSYLVSSTPAFAGQEPTETSPPSGATRTLHWNAAADAHAPSQEGTPSGARDVRTDVPVLAYAYTAYGAPAGAIGAQGYGQWLAASGQSDVLGGGATVWASPVDRLTLVLDAQRNVWRDFSPSLAVVGRLAGDSRDGWSLGALGKFKIDGFASGPAKDEVESEIELGALVSFVRSGWHLDLNVIGGRGTGDEGETDAEGRLRLGRNLGRLFRLGLDGQMRGRVAGPKYLPNGRVWDFAGGAQFQIGADAFYGALTAGPATMGLVTHSVGLTTVMTIGGTT